MPNLVSLLALFITTGLLFRLRSWAVRRKANPMGLPYPPGPRAYPLIGNIFDLPESYPWLKYAEWGKKYGDIVHIEALGRHLIILNSREVCADLLEKRSSVCSDKPHSIMLCEMWVHRKSVVCISYIIEWISRGLPRCCHTARCGSNTEKSTNSTSTTILPQGTSQNSWKRLGRHYSGSSKTLRPSETTFDCMWPNEFSTTL